MTKKSEQIQKLPESQWQDCPVCNNTGGYPVHICDGTQHMCNARCPQEEQCEFCWTVEASVFNQKRIRETTETK